jgi:UDP-N-acetylmuramate--alanine ligase
VLDIYPAREEPIAGVSAEMIVDKMNTNRKSVASLSNIVDVLKDKEFDVLLTMGAGNIDRIVGDVEKMLNAKYIEQ